MPRMLARELLFKSAEPEILKASIEAGTARVTEIIDGLEAATAELKHARIVQEFILGQSVDVSDE